MKKDIWNDRPHSNVKKFLKLNVPPENAVDIGCGNGRDTIALLEDGWNVLGIDKENVETIIREQLTLDESERFTFINCLFANMKLPKSTLIIANFSLPFAKIEYFYLVWNKIKNAILKDGYFVGNFLGEKDSWSNKRKNMVFLSEDEVKSLFKGFEMVEFKEIEKDAKSSTGKKKHWHIYDVIAKKK